jgi:hypothetical protein
MQRINSNFRFSRRLIKTHMACSNAGVPVFALSVSMAFTLHTGIHGQCFQQQNEQKLCCAGWVGNEAAIIQNRERNRVGMDCHSPSVDWERRLLALLPKRFVVSII